MPKEFIVKAVSQAVRKIPNHGNFKALDLSCGQGEVIKALHGDVASIEGTHYCANDYIIQNPDPILNEVKVHDNISLDSELPFDADSYDLVLMTEVIEHLPNHLKCLGEVARILKPNGYLVMTTPNTARLHSRVNFCMTGAHKLIRRRVGWDSGLSQWHEYHTNPVDFPTLHALLRALELDIEAVGSTKVKKRHLYLMTLYPIIWLASFREYRVAHGDAMFRMGEADLFRRMMSFPLLCSEQLLIVAKKENHL